MKKSFFAVFASVCLMTGVFLSGCIEKGKSVKDEKNVAVVNGISILSSDYNKNLERIVNAYKSQNPQSMQQPYAEDIVGKRLLQDMIVKEVLFQEAVKAKTTVASEDVNSVVEKTKESFKKDSAGKELNADEREKAFEAALKEQNLTKEKYAKNIEKDIIIEKFKRALVTQNLKPATEEETKTFFNNIAAVYNNDGKKIEQLKNVPGLFEEANAVAQQLKINLAEKAKIDVILVYADGNMTKEQLAERKALASAIRREVKNTESFDAVAQKYVANKDNKVYYSRMNVFKGFKPEKLSSKALSLDVGMISDPVEIIEKNAKANSAQGYFIIKVKEKAAEQGFVYSAFAKELENYINNKRAENILSQQITDFLNKSKIEIIKTFAVDKAVSSTDTQKPE